jgi:acyl-CoA hydrolase
VLDNSGIMAGKTVSASAIFDIAIDLDHFGSDGAHFEGRFIQVVNSLAKMVASRHTGSSCIVVGIDALRFRKKIERDDILLCCASVNCAWLTTLEVGIKVIAENFRSLERCDVFTAYFTFAAVDDEYRPVEIAPVIPESPEQIQRFHDAQVRHQCYCEEKNLELAALSK